MLTKERAIQICNQSKAINSTDNEHRQFMTADEQRHVEDLQRRKINFTRSFCDIVRAVAAGERV